MYKTQEAKCVVWIRNRRSLAGFNGGGTGVVHFLLSALLALGNALVLADGHGCGTGARELV